MRLPDSTARFTLDVPLSPDRLSAFALVLLAAALLFPAPTIAQKPFPQQAAQERKHDSSEWASIEPHLPDRVSSTPGVLEQEGDILKARRFPKDANDYYNFALQNGGDAAMLLNKIGLTTLELKDVPEAQRYFKRVVKLDRKSADGWNNLGTVEYLNGRPAYAIADLERAVKLDRGRAVFHCNLAMAYLERDDTKHARKEIEATLKLDPLAFERAGNGSGAALLMLSSARRPSMRAAARKSRCCTLWQWRAKRVSIWAKRCAGTRRSRGTQAIPGS